MSLLDGQGDYQVDPMSMGLLNAAMALGRPRALGGGVLAAMGGFQGGLLQADAIRRQQAQDAMRQKFLQAQIDETTAQADERKRATAAALAQQEGQRGVLADILGRAAPPPVGFRDVSVAMAAEQGVPPPPNYVPPQQRTAGPVVTQEHVARWVANNGDPAKLKQIVESGDWGRPEVAGTVEMAGPGGAPITRMRDRFGNFVGPEMAKPVEMRAVNTGAQTQFVNPFTQTAPLTMEQSPDSKASNAVAWSRLAFEKSNAGAADWETDKERGIQVNKRTGEWRPITSNGVPIPSSPSDALKSAESIRKEFAALPEVKSYKEVVPIVNSARMAADNPAGDIQIIYTLGKVMDPGSVVREGEMNMTIAAGSPAEKLRGYLNYVQGGGRLSPTLRNQLVTEAETRARAYQQSYNAARAGYEGIVKRAGISAADVFPDLPAITGPKSEPVDFKNMGKAKKPNGNGVPSIINFGDLRD